MSNNYWSKRFEEEEKQRALANDKSFKKIEKQYKLAEQQIKNDINKWYRRIADNNEISLADAKKLLKKNELQEFKWTLEEFTEKAKSGGWKKELENASARIHIQRLEALQLQVRNSIEFLGKEENNLLEEHLLNTYQNTYYQSLYEISKGFDLKTSFNVLDKNKINQVIHSPWLKDGKNFSDRLWQDKKSMVDTLSKKITQSFITGKDLNEAIENIEMFVSNTVKNKTAVARRLLETESRAYASKAQEQAFKNIDVEQYEIVATLDLKTSEICQEMDNKVFDMKDFEVGVTAPPFHCYCRTVIAPYFEDDESVRAARDENGEYVEVPYMNYTEWKEKYIKNEKENVVHKPYIAELEKLENFNIIEKDLPYILEEYNNIRKLEPNITNDVKDIVNQLDLKLEGLDFRLKTRGSLGRKIIKDSIDDGVSGKEAFDKLKDVVRYTTVLPEDTFTEKYFEMQELIKSKGYSIIKVKNTWEKGSNYKGINTTLKKDKLNFEMQYHTDLSLQVKEKLHILYEEERLITTSLERKKELKEEMIKLSESIPEPKGVEKIR